MAMRGSRGGSNRSEGTTVRGGRRHLGPGPYRHAWKEDVCVDCGVRREGYSGGYTGMTRYVFVDGSVDYRAGPCLGAPKSQ